MFSLLLATFISFGQSESESDSEPEYGVEQTPALLNSTNAVYHGEQITVNEFDKSTIKEITGGIDYTEKRDKEKKPDDTKEEEADISPTVSIPWGGESLRWIGYIVIIAAVLFFVFIIIKYTVSSPANPRLVAGDEQNANTVENIEELEVDKLLRQARENGDFRLMIRIQYLALLKTLHLKGLIKWERDKTNREYTMELFSKEVLYHEFRKLTLAYETVWYGEHKIDSGACELIMSGFKDIQQQLSTRSR